MSPLDVSLLALASAGLLAPVLTLASIAADKANGRGAWAGDLIEAAPEPPPAANPLVLEIGGVVPVIFKNGDTMLSGLIKIEGVSIRYRPQYEICDLGPFTDPAGIYRSQNVTGEIEFRFVPPVS